MKKKKKIKVLAWILIGIDICAVICFFLAYGPYNKYRDMLVTTAMGTWHHRYFAYILYDGTEVDRVVNANRMEIPEGETDTSAISFNKNQDTGVYESIYEEQVLKRDPGNDIYKVVDIKGDGWTGYMVVVYDPSDIELVFTEKLGKGEYLSTMAKKNDALLAVNASGMYTTYGNRNTGLAMKDGELYYQGPPVGYLIGFNKDNVLVLMESNLEKAKAAGIDRAVEFGPFLIVNGEEATFKGNGGWGIANRTGIGQRQDGIVLFMVINGRTASSPGISMKDLADLFVKYKAYNAANLDGGGTSALYGKRTLDGQAEMINQIKGFGYSGERYLPNCWMIKSTAIEKHKKQAEEEAAAEAAAKAAKLSNSTNKTNSANDTKTNKTKSN